MAPRCKSRAHLLQNPGAPDDPRQPGSRAVRSGWGYWQVCAAAFCSYTRPLPQLSSRNRRGRHRRVTTYSTISSTVLVDLVGEAITMLSTANSSCWNYCCGRHYLSPCDSTAPQPCGSFFFSLRPAHEIKLRLQTRMAARSATVTVRRGVRSQFPEDLSRRPRSGGGNGSSRIRSEGSQQLRVRAARRRRPRHAGIMATLTFTKPGLRLVRVGEA